MCLCDFVMCVCLYDFGLQVCNNNGESKLVGAITMVACKVEKRQVSFIGIHDSFNITRLPTDKRES